MEGFHRIAMCVPRCQVGNVAFNVQQLLSLAAKAVSAQAAVAVFPELSVTSASCGDFFRDGTLLEAAAQGVATLVEQLPDGPVYLVGAPVLSGDRLLNASIVIQNHAIRGIVSQRHPHGIFQRALPSGKGTLSLGEQADIPVGEDLLFALDSTCTFGVLVGTDRDALGSPAVSLALGGAAVLLNPCAERATTGQGAVMARQLEVLSRSSVSAFATVSAGVDESTTDGVCSGRVMAAEAGEMLLEGVAYRREGFLEVVDIDVERLHYLRRCNQPFADALAEKTAVCSPSVVRCSAPGLAEGLKRPLSSSPFIPSGSSECRRLCQDAFMIQKTALAKRIEHASVKKLVLGISGGLDSTLALLVCADTMAMLGRPATDVLALTLPGFGTSGRTYQNACALCRTLGVTLQEVSIKAACLQHFSDIGHDPAERNVVYENAQARERTQILLDLANEVGGLVVGTGDLSEAALGWCTFNGDHISQYGVNGSIPKSLMRCMIRCIGEMIFPNALDILQDIIDTPVSPELLPADEAGKISQKTENILGPYDVHDFFLYHFLHDGASPRKILSLAAIAFPAIGEEELRSYLKTFMRRFFSQQFKRNCMADGPAVGPISLSPRGGLAMPSDMSGVNWQNRL